MSNIAAYLSEIQKLTNKNLEILTAINEAFYTNKHHLAVNVDGQKYTIPSFISLENKLNTLNANFENLVNLPSTGEATMAFDGNTKQIQTMGYSQTPHKVDLEVPETFQSQSNDFFKDFVTPNVFVTFAIPTIANCEKNVNVKKICLKSDLAISRFSDNEDKTGYTIDYGTVRSKLYDLVEDLDYIEYDTIIRLPLREQTAVGDYDILKVESKSFNNVFTELYTLKLDTLKYKIDSGTIERIISVGDELVTNNDQVKLKVLAVRELINEIDVEVENQGFADLGDVNTGNEDMYKLHYFRSFDFDSTKAVNVTLEEDKHVIIFVAPINDTTNIMAPYGDGVYIDTDKLILDIDGQPYSEYKNIVKNLGDTLYGLTAIVDNTINNLSADDFNKLSNKQPIINESDITVTQINKHLNDSETVKNIRNLYAQKSEKKIELNSTQQEIDDVNNKLATINFDDTGITREVYSKRLNELLAKKSNIVASINSIISEITASVNASDVPIENAKYHIRGFIPDTKDAKVIKIDVEYRYKNKNRFTGNAMTIGDKYIFSDWNKMDSIYKVKTPFLNGGNYDFDDSESDNDDKNEISWNQIDIPISQGESVDIRVRYIYNYCYPYAEFHSAWSDIYNVEFPEELLENITVLDIIEENNDDTKQAAFTGVMTKYGVIDHVNDYVIDQDKKYLHNPDSIASGFFTQERRVIPLYDKLSDMDSIIAQLQAEILGASSENMVVRIYDNDHNVILNPFASNTFNLKDWTSNTNPISIFGNSSYFKYAQLTVDIYNAGVYNMKLFTSFPGNTNTFLGTGISGCNNQQSDSYTDSSSTYGIYGVNWKTSDTTSDIQKYNQWVYFRMYSIWSSSKKYYTEDSQKVFADTSSSDYNGTLLNAMVGTIPTEGESGAKLNYNFNSNENGAFIAVFPMIDEMNAESIDKTWSSQCASGEKYIVIPAGEHVKFLLGVYYGFNGSNIKPVKTTISFDLRTSLYQDPTNYEVTFVATQEAELIPAQQRYQAQQISGAEQTPYRSIVLHGQKDSSIQNKTLRR